MAHGLRLVGLVAAAVAACLSAVTADASSTRAPAADTITVYSGQHEQTVSALVCDLTAPRRPTGWPSRPRAAALVYNTGEQPASGLPASLLDLAKPQWKGKIGVAPGETDFHPLVTAIVKLRGKAAALAWLKGLKQNARLYEDNELLVAAVDKGEVATGLIDHYHWYRLRDEVGSGKTHLALHYFQARDPGMLVDVSGAAILKSSKRTAAARQFLAYLVSKPAQTIIATSQSYEYPLGSGVVTHTVTRPLASLQPARVTRSPAGRRPGGAGSPAAGGPAHQRVERDRPQGGPSCA